MLRLIIACSLFFASLGLAATTLPAAEILFSANNLADQENYIKRYYKIAQREMERSGVPASIKLAQGILESDSGKSSLARKANNHFGIKCGSNWKGDEYYKEDDDYDDNGRLVKSCFRQYRNPDASYVAHSEFLRDTRKAWRYGKLFRLKPNDYKGWAQGLYDAGYATNPRYPQLLISIIERHNLAQYDIAGFDDSDPLINDPFGDDPVVGNDEPNQPNRPTTPNQNPNGGTGTAVDAAITGILTRNDVNYFVSQKPISVAEVAKQVDLDVDRLLKYNEELDGSSQTVSAGERVFLQKKRRRYRGRESTYVVQAGEDLYDVAQKFGLRLKNLARRNRLEESADPATGESIKLRGSRLKEAPRLEGAVDPNAAPPSVPTTPGGNVELDEDDLTTPGTNPAPGTTVRPNPGAVVVPRPTGPVVRPNPNEAPPTVVPPNARPATGPDATTAQYHTVAGGETLYAISRRYGLTVAQIQRLNGLTTTGISVGQQLRVR